MDAEADEGLAPSFHVRVGSFDGPFDLLLDLIGRHELDVTEVALSAVTDEFLAHLARLGETDLETASGFLVVGATLLDAKIAGLLPQGEAVDAEAVALLEARDLLFARLLQYRAFKGAAAWLEAALAGEAVPHAHRGGVEDRHRLPAPPAVPPLDPAAFALLAAAVTAVTAPPVVRTDHLHAASVSLRAEAAQVVSLLRRGPAVSFADLTGDAARPVVVARFLAVLELHRLGAVAFEQVDPLGALLVRWIAPDWDDHGLDRLGGGDG